MGTNLRTHKHFLGFPAGGKAFYKYLCGVININSRKERMKASNVFMRMGSYMLISMFALALTTACSSDDDDSSSGSVESCWVETTTPHKSDFKYAYLMREGYYNGKYYWTIQFDNMLYKGSEPKSYTHTYFSLSIASSEDVSKNSIPVGTFTADVEYSPESVISNWGEDVVCPKGFYCSNFYEVTVAISKTSGGNYKIEIQDQKIYYSSDTAGNMSWIGGKPDGEEVAFSLYFEGGFTDYYDFEEEEEE